MHWVITAREFREPLTRISRGFTRVASVFIPGISSTWGFNFPAASSVQLEDSARIAMEPKAKEQLKL
jgi:hypothetical protein